MALHRHALTHRQHGRSYDDFVDLVTDPKRLYLPYPFDDPMLRQVWKTAGEAALHTGKAAHEVFPYIGDLDSKEAEHVEGRCDGAE